MQYQVVVDRTARAYCLTLADRRTAIERGSAEAGGRVAEIPERDTWVRGLTLIHCLV